MSARHLLVTGASSGLGAALARDYAAPGVLLTLVARDEARLAAVAADCRAKGAEVETGAFDVGAREPLGGWLSGRDVRAPFDLVLACAGVSAGTREDGEPEGVELAALQVRTNLLGAIHTVEPLLPAMMRRGRGQIALVSSVAGLRGLPYSPAYSASKAGVRAYGEALRALLAPRGVAVTVIVPGFFDTPMTDRFEGPKPFLMSLERTASIVRRGVEARRPRITFPRLLAMGAKATDLMPAWAGDRIQRRFRFHIRPGH